jgi:uncharacterized protein YndB with AHSA1/START domain
MTPSTDRIHKQVLLRAPRARVWSAISDAKQFGAWFGIDFDGPFAPGARVTGRIAPTTVDAEVAKLQEPHRGKAATFVIDRVEPMRLFSFRWHPYAIDPQVDYASEPMTLVVFELHDAAEGILLSITESGFDRIPLARRAAAFQANDGGWAHQARLIEKYLSRA